MPTVTLALSDDQHDALLRALGHGSPVDEAMDFLGHEVGRAVAVALSLPRPEGQARLGIRTRLAPGFAREIGCGATHEVIVDVPRARG
jgi:hypothetical protein